MESLIFFGTLGLFASLPAIVILVLLLVVPGRWGLLVLLAQFMLCTIGYHAMGGGKLDEDRFGFGKLVETAFWFSMFVCLLIVGIVKTIKQPSPLSPPGSVTRFVNGGTAFALALAFALPIYPLYFGLFANKAEGEPAMILSAVALIALVGFLRTNTYDADNELSAAKVFWAASPLAWAATVAWSLLPPASATSPAPEKIETQLPCKTISQKKTPRKTLVENPQSRKLPAFEDLKYSLIVENEAEPRCSEE